MFESLNYPLDAPYILKKRKSIKRALKAPGETVRKLGQL